MEMTEDKKLTTVEKRLLIEDIRQLANLDILNREDRYKILRVCIKAIKRRMAEVREE